jgi:hypothetical protein
MTCVFKQTTNDAQMTAPRGSSVVTKFDSLVRDILVDSNSNYLLAVGVGDGENSNSLFIDRPFIVRRKEFVRYIYAILHFTSDLRFTWCASTVVAFVMQASTGCIINLILPKVLL